MRKFLLMLACQLVWAAPLSASRIDSLTTLLEAQTRAAGTERAAWEAALGDAYAAEYMFHESTEHYEKALALQREHGSPEQVYQALFSLGYTRYIAYDYSKALQYFNETLALADELENDSLRALAYDWMSLQYLYSDAYGQAIAHQLKSIRLRESRHDSFGLAESYYSMGDILGHQHKLDESKTYFRQCIRLATQFSQDYLLVGAYGSVGQHFIQQQNWDSAFWYGSVALRIATENNMDYGVAFCNNVLADCFRERGLIDSAARRYHLALQKARYMSEYEETARALLGLGKLAVLESRADEAFSRFRQALAITVAYDLRVVKEEAHASFAEGYAHFGQYDSAYRYQQALLAVKDSMFLQRSKSMISTLEARYSILQQESEQQAALLAKDHQLRRQTLWVTGIIGFLLLALGWIGRHNLNNQRRLNAVLETSNHVIKVQNGKLVQANEDLKQFAYAASHDLKQPLRTIGNFAGLLERKFKGKIDEDAADYFAFIRQATRDMATLLTNLLEYTQLENKADSYEELDLNHILQNVQINLSQMISEKQANVLSEWLPSLEANREHMHQLFQNLINNGIKFNDKSNPEIQISVESLEDRYLFAVRDNGVGIDPEYVDKVFGLFQRVGDRSAFEGTGMGLAIAKRIVQQYNGQIWVESTPEHGSTFYFTVPKTAMSQAA